VQQLTRNEGSGTNEADDHGPSWSPDGTAIAFTSTRDHRGDGFESNELYVMESDGSGHTRLTDNALGEGGPRWSPDGERIAFVRRGAPRRDRIEAALVARDGTGMRTLVENGELILSVDWSPDGSRIAFTSCPGAFGGREIWVSGADGRGARQLTDSVGRNSDPVWSPDGSRIAFVSERDRNGRCFFHDLHRIQRRDLRHERGRLGGDAPDRRSRADESPAWSPDGERIAFAGLRDVVGDVDEEDFEIYVMDADGENLRPLTDNRAWDVEPDWGRPRA
jgi:Tol biopolymer transport system component